MALNAMLAEAHWAGAPEAAGSRRDAGHEARAGARRHGAGRRAELDEDAGEIDTTAWFEPQG